MHAIRICTGARKLVNADVGTWRELPGPLAGLRYASAVDLSFCTPQVTQGLTIWERRHRQTAIFRIIRYLLISFCQTFGESLQADFISRRAIHRTNISRVLRIGKFKMFAVARWRFDVP